MRVAAVDLGASSGRVMVLGGDSVDLHEVHRFRNRPVQLGGTLHWNALGLYQGIVDGLRAAGSVDAIGIDGWAVDYGLLDGTGALLGNPVHYRDRRTHGVPDSVHGRVPADELYRRTGVQAQPFNTIYQLAASRESPQLAAADGLLLLPDLMAYWLTGRRVAELTNASTTGLLDISTKCWDPDLISIAGARYSLFAELVRPGHLVGGLRSDVWDPAGQRGETKLIAVGSHDTASAVAAIPARGRRFAYVATGTWSLVGVETDQPVLTDASRLAGFTNELGLDGRVRFLRNVMGLWLLQECLREWGDPPLDKLLSAAAEQPSLRTVVDAAAAEFLPPGDMPRRLAAACRRTRQFEPETAPEITRCVLDSLALGHARAIRQAVSLAQHPVDVVHLVGGGANNALLCQLTADAVGIPVLAGPVEAAALGNALVQQRTLSGREEDLESLRSRVADGVDVTKYEPQAPSSDWAQAEARIFHGDELWIGKH